MASTSHTNSLSAVAAVLAVCAAVCSTDPAHAQNKFVMDDNQFNQWLYQGNGQTADEESEITLMVESIDRSCHLNDAQKTELRLAAHGDYARFNQKVEDLRSECVGKSYDQNT